MKIKCNCGKNINFKDSYFVDNDNLAVCKDCYETKLYEVSKQNSRFTENKIIQSKNEEKV
jgi:ribosome-binding protein aMBF1 (putative translation factor)